MLYMTYQTPPFPLARLASFVIIHYAPQWFAYRKRWRATDAPKVFFEGLLRTKQLLPEERTKVMNVLQRNAFWSHPENLILSLLADDNAAVRSDGVDRVLRLRHLIAEPVPVKIVYYRNLLNLMVPDLN